MKILLLGKNGQVGRELQRSLLPLGPVEALARADINLQDIGAVEAFLDAVRPELIVNAAAYTAVDRAESDAAAAHAVNATAVGAMARFAARQGATLVHYSTDYVFDGRKATPYVESDETAPQSVYGLTKRDGERAIAESGCDSLVFRTSWVFSAHGSNFIKTMLRLAQGPARLRVVADQIGAPTSAELIADVTALAIRAHRRGDLPSGLYHMTAAGQTTWHGLATYALAGAVVRGAALRQGPDDVEAISTEEYPLPAKRPRSSLMDTSALAAGAGITFPDWTAHVDRMLDQLYGGIAP